MSVTAAGGFRAAGVAAGIKPSGLDLALVVSDVTASAAGVFTTNRAAAAPVRLSRRHLATATARAVILNSGSANAGTGPEGDRVATATARAGARMIGCAFEDVLVCSTGAIGEPLDADLVVNGIRDAESVLAATPEGGVQAAMAILTTDSRPKLATFNGAGFSIGGMVKGAGMIRPNMATMLSVITTDAVVDAALLASALREAVGPTFNALDIDGCASTNDTVLVLANGASGIAPSAAEFAEGLTAVCRSLAREIAEDAEGATRVVTLAVVGTRSDADALTLGRAMCDSALVRASFYGGDPNWGRLLAAAGEAPVEFDPASFRVEYQGVAVARDGMTVNHDSIGLLAALESGPIQVTVAVGDGPGCAEMLTTDLTPEYARFNGERS